MQKLFIYPYKKGSASAKALANALGVKRIKLTNSKFKPKGKSIINWGSSSVPYDCNVINPPSTISEVSNKLTFFTSQTNAGNGEYVVPWTVSREQASEWLSEGQTVVARTKLTGHSGEGIVLLEGADAASEALAIVEAPLYTLYVPKKEEYRVHCYREPDFIHDDSNNYHVFDIQRKAKRSDVPKEEANYRIRNLDGGFIYARQELNVPECVKSVALEVFRQTGLDFGAVDVIYNEKQDRAYALEVNTAPGLAGTTLKKYVEMFKEMLDG